MRRPYYRSADLRELVEIITYTTTTDAAGGTEPTYATSYTTFAKVDPYDGDLFLEGGARVLNNKTSFTLRYRGSLVVDNQYILDASYKIKYMNDDYIVHSTVLDDPKKYYLRVLAYKKK
jgi:head-tail adaptor